MGKYRVAFYLRVSKEDESGLKRSENVFERNRGSIGAQRLLLKKYAEKHFADYEIYEFCDDGYTGTNFQRPGVQRLLEMAENSQIDCIMVKDLSRFARDYIELGEYLERNFPIEKVRFISVNDGYDSEYCAGNIPELNVRFKNLLYDLYSRDISQKVRSALKAKKDAGNYVTANVPFGYRRSLNMCGSVEPDEEEACVVRRIFELALQGMTSPGIADYLNKTGVKTPAQFKIERGEKCRKPKENFSFWSSSSVRHILKNEFYIGHAVQKKYSRNYADGKTRLNSVNERQVIFNHHAAIVEEDIFERANAAAGGKGSCGKKRNSAAENRNLTTENRNSLTGIAVCGGCGRNLLYRKTCSPYFTCQYRYYNNNENCVARVEEDFLRERIISEFVRLAECGTVCAEGEEKEIIGAEGTGKELIRLEGIIESGKTICTKEIIEKYIEKITVFDESKIKIYWRR